MRKLGFGTPQDNTPGIVLMMAVFVMLFFSGLFAAAGLGIVESSWISIALLHGIIAFVGGAIIVLDTGYEHGRKWDYPEIAMVIVGAIGIVAGFVLIFAIQGSIADMALAFATIIDLAVFIGLGLAVMTKGVPLSGESSSKRKSRRRRR